MAQDTLKILELFSGFECVSNAFRKKGHECFTIDWDERFDSSLHKDISELTIDDLPEEFRHPDIVFVGIDCTTYSVAAISKHRRKDNETGNLIPISEKAKFADDMALHVKELIKELNPKIQIWENPVGGLRKMWFMQDLPYRNTTTYCFSGDTEIITDNGFKKLNEIGENQINVLNINGEYEKAYVHNYGKQQLYKVTLSRAKKKREIYCTKEHLWFATEEKNPKTSHYQLVETKDLKKGMLLPFSKQPQKDFLIIDEYVAMGFVFGDGWIVKKELSTGSHIQFVNEKQEMMKYFNNFGGKRWEDSTSTCKIIKTCSLPLEWKYSIPSITDSPSKIASWIAGYFAADGSISMANGQITLSSSIESNLIKVKELAESIGIQTLSINKYLRLGLGKTPTYLYQLTFAKKNFPKELLLRQKHIKSFEKNNATKFVPQRWSVVSIESTNRNEDVFCCETQTTHSFTLVDGIVTHNCQYGFSYRKATDFFSNIDLHLKQPCKNGSPCHESAPRGAKTGLQGITDKALKAIYPPLLCDDIVKTCEETIGSLQ